MNVEHLNSRVPHIAPGLGPSTEPGPSADELQIEAAATTGHGKTAVTVQQGARTPMDLSSIGASVRRPRRKLVGVSR